MLDAGPLCGLPPTGFRDLFHISVHLSNLAVGEYDRLLLLLQCKNPPQPASGGFVSKHRLRYLCVAPGMATRRRHSLLRRSKLNADGKRPGCTTGHVILHNPHAVPGYPTLLKGTHVCMPISDQTHVFPLETCWPQESCMVILQG